MSAYEARIWVDLNDYWTRKSQRRALPPRVQRAAEAVAGRTGQVVSTSGHFVSDHTPEAIKNAGSVVIDKSLESTVRAVLALLEYVTEKVQDLTNPDVVIAHHQDNEQPVQDLDDLYKIDLEHLDQYTRRMPIQWRTGGIAEGAAMGALAFVPVAGSIGSVAADLVVMHALSTAIVTRIAYAYGIDPTRDDERHHLDRMLRKAWAQQGSKTATVKQAADAYKAGAKRIRWSDRFRQDHRIAAALEKLMQKAYGADHVAIGKVVKALPLAGVVTSAGINSHVLGSLAKTSIRYSQTVYLAKKYGLSLPPNLRSVND